MVSLVWISLFAALFFSWYFYLKARTTERTLLIEKGADASNFYAKRPDRKGFSFSFPWLKLGLLLVGISLGLIVGTIFVNTANFVNDIGEIEEPIMFGSTVLFAGLSMIVAHLTGKKK